MYGINLFSIFSKPTRTTSTSARLIDKGLINDISDHLSVFCNYILHKMTFVINDQVSKLIYCFVCCLHKIRWFCNTVETESDTLKWCINIDKLSSNVDKTKYIIFGHQKNNNQVKMMINNIEIERVWEHISGSCHWSQTSPSQYWTKRKTLLTSIHELIYSFTHMQEVINDQILISGIHPLVREHCKTCREHSYQKVHNLFVLCRETCFKWYKHEKKPHKKHNIWYTYYQPLCFRGIYMIWLLNTWLKILLVSWS